MSQPGELTDRMLGAHPFPVRVIFGDERRLAYARGPDGEVSGPGVQVMTAATEMRVQSVRGALLATLDALDLRFPYVLNVACQSPPQQFHERVQAAGAGGQGAEAQDALRLFKEAVDEAGALGPQAIVRAAVTHLADPVEPGGDAYGNLLRYVNCALGGEGRNARIKPAGEPVRRLDDLAPEGIDLWWVKEGSATIVFQVHVSLGGGRPPARFVLNVAKDLTGAAQELQQTYADFVALYGIEPAYVMQPFGLGVASIATWRGPVSVPVLAAEWFDGHELHVYGGSPRLHIWQDQHMGAEHPLPPEVSDRIWSDTIRIRARYTRRLAEAVVPIDVQIDAGDFIFRRRDDGGWDILLIWFRRPPPGVPGADFLVVNSLLAGATPYELEPEPTVFWDQPARALEALRLGLTEAGWEPVEINALLRAAWDGAFMGCEGRPERIAYLHYHGGADPGALHGAFQRARDLLKTALG